MDGGSVATENDLVPLLVAIAWSQIAIFTSLTVVAFHRWRRRRSESSSWLLLAFTVAGGVVLVARFLPPPTEGLIALWIRKVLVGAVVLFPYCLFRFTRAFLPATTLTNRCVLVSTCVTGAAMLTTPRFVPAGEARPPWVVACAAAFAGHWTLLSLLSVVRLWRGGRSQPTVTRRRVRTLALATAALNLSLLVLVAAPGLPTSLGTAGRLGGLVATVLFAAGFAPPRALRSLWRRPDVIAFHGVEAELMAADTTERVAAVVLPHASRLVGATAAALLDGAGEAVATFGMSPAEARALIRRLPPRHDGGTSSSVEGDDGLIGVPVRAGWLVMTTDESTPFFGSGELELVTTLALYAGLALDRAELLARERLHARLLADREAQLAEAQRTAMLGSYVWDVEADVVSWSDEMYRVLGFDPGDPDARARFLDRVHPDDRQWVVAHREAVRAERGAASHEWRITLPGGEVRWIQARVRPGADAAASKVYGTVQDITERKAAEEAIVFQATHDALTQLPNRPLFLARLEEALRRRAATGGGVALLFLDLDRFKWVNDSLGHAAGDAILVELSRRLQTVVRPGDTVARLAGDEFVVLCDGLAGQAEAEAVAAEIAAAIARPVPVAGEEVVLSVSIGLAYRAATDPGDLAEDLLRDADVAMYQAKEHGRDRVVAFDISARLAAVARHETVTALRRGIGRDELVVHYQPEIDITTGATVGVEALVRWNHPQRGLLAPAEFVPLAEESGLIVPLGAEVLRVACAQVASWQRTFRQLAGMSLSVNLAARQLLAPDLTSVVEEALAASGLDARHLFLEITESVLLEDGEASAQALRRLQAVGVGIGVDDFGTGFSSLTYLKRFPVDILKIDRSFVEGLGRNREDRAIVAGVIDLAHAFGLTTIAEGVETVGQLGELRALGCEQAQGHFWSRPLDAGDAEAWFLRNTALPTEIASSPRRTAQDGDRPASMLRGRRHRVLLVDDDRPIRRLLRMILEDDDDFEIVGETDDGREAVALARHHRPDLVLLDLAMPAMGGLEALPLILAVAPDAKVVVLSGLDGVGHLRSAERQGASAYVLKGDDLTGLAGTLRPLLAAGVN